MSEEMGKYNVDNVVEHKTMLYLLAQRLKDVAAELDKLSEEEKRVVIERADQKNAFALKELYNALNEYMGW